MIQHDRIDVAGCRDKEHEGRRRRDGPSAKCGSTGMGKMWNCSMRNAEGKMRNGMCGVTVIGRYVTSRDCIYSAFHHTLCVNCVELNCILSMRKIAFCTMHATFRCTAFSLPGQFAPQSESANRTLPIRSGTFALWPIRSLALSFR